jgi:hypothetical protein
MTAAPASAANGPGGRPSAPAGRASADNICLLELGSLTASATTTPVGTNVTLSTTTSCDIGPTPYFLQIFDVTTGTLVRCWGSGTSFSAPVSENVATTQGYVAYLATSCGSSPPTTGVYQKSATTYVTWTSGNFTVTLTGPAEIGNGQGPATYTATANQDVGPTPYWIEIFDETTGTELTNSNCGSGTTCQVLFTPSVNGDDLVAFVSSNSSALPPAGTQASSNVLHTFQLPNIQ